MLIPRYHRYRASCQVPAKWRWIRYVSTPHERPLSCLPPRSDRDEEKSPGAGTDGYTSGDGAVFVMQKWDGMFCMIRTWCLASVVRYAWDACLEVMRVRSRVWCHVGISAILVKRAQTTVIDVELTKVCDRWSATHPLPFSVKDIITIQFNCMCAFPIPTSPSNPTQTKPSWISLIKQSTQKGHPIITIVAKDSVVHPGIIVNASTSHASKLHQQSA